MTLYALLFSLSAHPHRSFAHMLDIKEYWKRIQEEYLYPFKRARIS